VKGNTRQVANSVFSPDSQRVVVGGVCESPDACDGTVRVWEIAGRKELMQLRGHVGRVNCATFSPDGRWIVTAGDDRTVRLWDASTGRNLGQLGGHEEPILRAQFSADARWIASSGLDTVIRLWATPAPRGLSGPTEPLVVLRGHQHSVTATAFSADGRWLASSSEDDTARVWEMPGAADAGLSNLGLNELLALAKARAPRALTAEERKIHLQQ
jgi:WD40 repeat protein